MPSFNIANFSDVAWVLLMLGAMLLLGFLGTRITRLLKLPNVTAYILVGVLIGPSVLNLFPSELLKRMDFITDLALSFIAFSVGKYFRISSLKENGKKVVVITIIESFLAAILVTIVMYFFFHLSLSFSLILGAIASSTAPASTIMTIKQTKSKGVFVDTLLQVVALDDVTCLLAFSVAIAITNAVSSGTVDFVNIVMPLVWNVVCIVFGFVLGWLLSLINKTKISRAEKLVVLLSIILLNGFICNILEVSPLLSCMVLGATYVNFTKDDDIFDNISDFSDPIMIIFFIYSGSKLSLASLATLGIPGVIYFIVRIIGKYAGASIGGAITKSDKSITKYLGLALIPQAGVSIGLAALGARMLPQELGEMLTTIILSSSILYEIFGPASAKLALTLSKSYDVDAFKRKKHKLLSEGSYLSYNYINETKLKRKNKEYSGSSVQFKIYHRNHDSDDEKLL